MADVPRDEIVEDLYPELWILRLFAKQDDAATPVTSLTGSSYLTPPRSGGYKASPRNQASLPGPAHYQPEVGASHQYRRFPSLAVTLASQAMESRSPVQQRAVGHHGVVVIVQKRLRESGEAMTNLSDLTVILVDPSACLITVLG